jgi:hypothetical protein
MTQKFFVIEVDDGDRFVGHLFRTVFGGAAPAYPRHFVCFLDEGNGRFHVAGYAHFSRFEGCWLGGGLVVDKTVYPRVSASDLAACGPNNSIGEFVVADAIRQLGNDDPVFAYIGDPRSITVNLNAGYVETHIPKLYAFWKRPTSPEIQRAVCERVARLIPF